MLRYIPTLLIGMSLFVLTLTTLGVNGVIYSQPFDDPFAPYDAIAPGAPRAALAQFSCLPILPEKPSMYGWFGCQISPLGGPFRRVTVMGYRDRIANLWFEVKGLQVGHLAQRWGRPDFIRRGNHTYMVRWGGEIYAMVERSGWFTYQSAVRFISIKASPAVSYRDSD
jgi:hypothetical protein